MNKKSELFYIKVEFKNLSSQEVSTPGYYYLGILKSSHRKVFGKCFSNSYCIQLILHVRGGGYPKLIIYASIFLKKP